MANFKYIGTFDGEGKPLTIRVMKQDGSIQEFQNVIPNETIIETDDEKSKRYLRADTTHFQEIL